ncbi:MAG: PEP-CTERM sorting domain-containing protein [Acidobacteriia bacterium]|nr:PEP-CTERM sorting domain-containing protein [Terriglobia bacterium]
MAAKKTYSTIGAVFIGVFVLNIAAQASTAVFSTFTTTDYSNNASQTSGIFRDFLNNSSINRGTITTGTFNTSGLTFAGVTGGPTADWTLYDTSPSLAPADLLTTKHVTESLDFEMADFNNATGQTGLTEKLVGLLGMFNEGTGQVGLAMTVDHQGNGTAGTTNAVTTLALYLISQTGNALGNGPIASVRLTNNANIAAGTWYRLDFNYTLSSTGLLTVVGDLFRHSTAANSNSALDPVALANLSFIEQINAPPLPQMGALNQQGIGEAGVIYAGGSTRNGVNVTNYRLADQPEPATLAMMCGGIAGLLLLRRRYAK